MSIDESVVLPQPLPPTMKTISPERSCKSISPNVKQLSEPAAAQTVRYPNQLQIDSGAHVKRIRRFHKRRRILTIPVPVYGFFSTGRWPLPRIGMAFIIQLMGRIKNINTTTNGKVFDLI